MKRSEINEIQESAKAFFREQRFFLPPWSQWRPADWKTKGPEIDEIRQNMLGWDVTDFGSGNFLTRGLFLFTLRNGSPDGLGKPYAEKIMIVQNGQETPMHFHRNKMEDIINRGGARLMIELYRASDQEGLSDLSFEVSIDGIRRLVAPGSTVVLLPGESICLESYIYHRFWAEGGTCLVGEVSKVNDDNADNRFLEPLGRFPEVEEDVEPLHLLVSDYAKLTGAGK